MDRPFKFISGSMGESVVTVPSAASGAESTELIGGRYRVKRELGRGGMGTVVLAHHEGLDRDVAIKLLSSDVATNHEFIVRLQREAKAVAMLKSKHAVRVTDVDTLEDAGPYMVMEYLEGRSLRQEADERGPLPVGEVVGYALEALDALVEAHALGIVHRDLKPSNLFLAARADGTRCLKVLDFGISKFEPLSEPTDDLTSSRALLGTPLYMSPEQLKSPKTVDARADIWSLGVVMYELLAGKAPFTGNTVGELCFSIVETRPKSLSSMRDDVPAALDRVVQRCLRRDPSDRYASAEELARALAPFGPGVSGEARGQRRWLRGSLVVAVAIVVAAAITIWRLQRRDAPVAAAQPESAAPTPTLALPASPPPIDEPAPPPAATPTAAKPARPPSATAKPPSKHPKAPPSVPAPAGDPNLDQRH
jgi:serine/threonine-protein kinase